MTHSELQEVINTLTRPAFVHVSKTYHTGNAQFDPFINVPGYTINLEMSYEQALKIIQSLRK